MRPVRLALALGLLLALSPAHAVQPDEVMRDPALEARAPETRPIRRFSLGSSVPSWEWRTEVTVVS